jgi:hypothetical protein
MALTIPKSWKDININQFLQIHAALEMRDIDTLDRNIYLAAALLNTNVDWVEDNMTLQQIGQVIREASFAQEEPKGKVKKYFWLNGRLWKVELEAKNITPAQFFDLSTYTKTPQETVDNVAKIMATICRPIFTKYDSDKIEARAKMFGEKMRFDFAYATSLFFWGLYNKFCDATLTYLAERLKVKTKEAEALNQGG